MSNTNMLNLDDINTAMDDTTIEDQSVTKSGGGDFERKRLPMGRHAIRLVSYIEMGMQDGGMYDGAQKADEEQARMVFEFLGKRAVEEKEDGTLYAPRKTLTKKLSNHAKAGFHKLFLAMRNGDSTITHMGNMIAKQAWLVTVTWRTKGDDGKYMVIKASEVSKYEDRLKAAVSDADKKDFRIFDNIDWASISAPVTPIMDDDGEDTGETKPMKVRPVIGGLQLFFWDNPTPQLWGSLFIEGSYKKTVNEKEIDVSKNYIQEAILGAKNYEGSPLEAMLEGLDDLPMSKEPEPEEKAEVAVKKPVKAAATKKPEASSEDLTTVDTADAATTSPSEDEDLVNTLGLTEDDADEYC